jgi:uncharacterized membrane protein
MSDFLPESELREEIKNHYKKKYILSPKELMVKTIVLRFISSFITAILIFALTGSLNISILMLGIDFCIKMVVYYYFELLWFKFRKFWSSEDRAI